MSDSEPAVVETKVRDDRTILTIEGWPEASVIVRSESGERIYLPPEEPEPAEDDDDTRTSPYSTGDTDDEDDGDGPSPTPYSTAVESDDEDEDDLDRGRSQVRQGIRIIHSEPVTDVRVLQ